MFLYLETIVSVEDELSQCESYDVIWKRLQNGFCHQHHGHTNMVIFSLEASKSGSTCTQFHCLRLSPIVSWLVVWKATSIWCQWGH